ncbi:hypothetical protein [Trichothermofontia sp.]
MGLGLGFRRQWVGGIEKEILAWYDAQGNAYPTPGDVERQRAEAERRRAEQLAHYLRSLGVDPDNLPNPWRQADRGAIPKRVFEKSRNRPFGRLKSPLQTQNNAEDSPMLKFVVTVLTAIPLLKHPLRRMAVPC